MAARSPHAFLAITLLALAGCAEERSPGSDDSEKLFEELAGPAGIDFEHFNGMTGRFYIPEVLGPGGALIDYDRDGDLDLYLVQGQLLGPDASVEEAVYPPPAVLPLRDRLLQNRLVEEGTLRFVDVTESSGIDSRGYGMGAAVGDVDDDGWPDLYVTNFGENELFRNRGDGSFERWTVESGTGEDRWSTSAAFVDYDRDGRLDLYVCNYVDFSFSDDKKCFAANSGRDYCGPDSYRPFPDRLFRGVGGGRFEDVTVSAGLAREYGAALGVVAGDFDGDGGTDLYVANDGQANQLWMNRGDGTFAEQALLGGSAFNSDGEAEGSMGIDAADFDGDGDEDLFMTHLTTETNTLYRNLGQGRFEDATASTGLGAPSRPFTGFGAGFLDFENDGWLDLVSVNGAIQLQAEQARHGDPFPLRQRNQLFRNVGGRFEEIAPEELPVLGQMDVSRGTLLGDLDNDGDTDLVICNNSGPTRLWLNRLGQRERWLGVVPVRSGSDLVWEGARVELLVGDRRLVRTARRGNSYCSAGDPRIRFGLGPTGPLGAVRVDWPDGTVETWSGLPLNEYTMLRAGSGEPVVAGTQTR